VVVAEAEPSGLKQLLAYVVPSVGARVSEADMRAALGRELPDYMIPARFVFLDSMPLTPNGKVDRRALLAVPRHRRTETAANRIVKPRDVVEVQVMRIWEQLLDIQGIGVRDNFFALGGHSLLAVRMIARIEQLFGKKLPLDILWYQDGTIESLVHFLRGDKSSALWSHAVAIQPLGSRSPLFCAPVAGGHLYHWDNVARHLSLDQPVYGLPAKGVDGSHKPDTTIEAIATHCVHLMREVQPAGPYSLAGFCAGGTVAFEMARQLEISGQRLALLALVDSLPPNRAIHLMKELMVNLFRRGQFPYVNERLECMMYQILDLAPPKSLERLTTGLTAAHRWALWGYVPKKISGRVTLFNPADDTLSRDAPACWTKLAGGGLELYSLPGKHNDLTQEPGVRLLGRTLEQCLRKNSAAE